MHSCRQLSTLGPARIASDEAPVSSSSDVAWIVCYPSDIPGLFGSKLEASQITGRVQGRRLTPCRRSRSRKATLRTVWVGRVHLLDSRRCRLRRRRYRPRAITLPCRGSAGRGHHAPPIPGSAHRPGPECWAGAATAKTTSSTTTPHRRPGRAAVQRLPPSTPHPPTSSMPGPHRSGSWLSRNGAARDVERTHIGMRAP